MRFAFVEAHRHVIPVNRLCEIMDVSPQGYRSLSDLSPLQLTLTAATNLRQSRRNERPDK